MCQSVVVQSSTPCLGGMTNWIVQKCQRFDIENVGDDQVMISAKVRKGMEWIQVTGKKEDFRAIVTDVYNQLQATLA